MAKDELIDGHVSLKQSTQAVEALHKHATKKQQEREKTELLLGKEQHVWLQVTVKAMHPEKKLKPHKIPIVHPIVDPRVSSVCLITKDPQREYKDLLDTHKIKFISRVVGIEKLKGKFKPFEARRLLLKENELFLADERVVPLLPGLLGKIWFDAKKQPIPVNLTRKDLKGELERAISSTYFHQNKGTCSSIKIGSLTHTPDQIVANLKTALPAVVKAIKGSWDNVQSLHIKTNSSASLPIWTCELGSGEGGRWDELVEDADVEMSDEGDIDSDEDEEKEEEPVVKKRTKKGKKRVAEKDADEEEKPRKKKAKQDPSEEDSPAVAAKVSPVKPSSKPSPTTKASKQTVPEKAKTQVEHEDAASSTPEGSKRKRKRRKSAVNDAPSSPSKPELDSAAPVAQETLPAGSSVALASDSASQPKKKKRSKKARGSEVSITTDPPTTQPIDAPADPVTPNVAARKKTSRASAADYFEPSESTPIAVTSDPAPPPNTLADALTGPASQGETAPKEKRRRKKSGVEGTPVTAAISKLSVAENMESDKGMEVDTEKPAVSGGENKGKKEKRKKKAKGQAVAGGEEVGKTLESVITSLQPPEAPNTIVTEKKKKRRHRKGEEDISETGDRNVDEDSAPKVTPALTMGELKQKKSKNTVERNKEKVRSGKAKEGKGKSVKEDLIGKKGLQH